MREWDPIGISDVPEVADEYDDYVAKIYVMLMDERAGCEVIAAYLFDIAANHMGISDHARLEECSFRAAATLVAMRPGFETH